MEITKRFMRDRGISLGKGGRAKFGGKKIRSKNRNQIFLDPKIGKSVEIRRSRLGLGSSEIVKKEFEESPAADRKYDEISRLLDQKLM